MTQNLNRSDIFNYWRGMMADLFGRYPFVSFILTDRYRIIAFGWFQKKFEAAGWLVAKKDAAHRCPGCYSAIKARQAIKNETKENVVVLHTSAPEAPREMTRDDRRIVFEKLNEVYVDEKTGYGDGWTDAKVANDLGVPRAWVTAIRDEMFGPEGSNEEIRVTVAEATALLGQIREFAKTIEPLRDLLNKADSIEKRLGQIQKDLR